MEARAYTLECITHMRGCWPIFDRSKNTLDLDESPASAPSSLHPGVLSLALSRYSREIGSRSNSPAITSVDM
jgi:hypothetical protein